MRTKFAMRPLLSLWLCARRAVADAGGSVAIEFAFLVPVMLTMLGACVVAGEALAIGQKVTSTARTVTDIVSQNTALSTTQLKAILDASAYTMAPYPSANLSIVVSEVQTSSTSATTHTGTVTWSKGDFNGAALAQNATVTLPPGMYPACGTGQAILVCPTYIYGQVTYSFSPPIIGAAVTGPIALSDSSWWSPRKSSVVTFPYPN